MANQTAKIPAKNFKALIEAVLKFPPSAVVSASEIVHFSVTKGRARASVAGLVSSSATVIAAGETDAVTVDYRVIGPYAALCSNEFPVSVEISKKTKEVCFACGDNKLTIPFTFGAVVPKLPLGAELFKVEGDCAKTLRWLAGIAENDDAKPDMSCVYVRQGTAMAGNQRCIAVSKAPGLPTGEYALPLALCGVLQTGDLLTAVAGGLVLRSGCGVHSIPFQSETLKFPVRVVDRLSGSKATVFGTCVAKHLADAFKESADCVARIPKTEAVIELEFRDGRLHLHAFSGTAHYRTAFLGEQASDGILLIPLPEAESAIGVFDKDKLTLKQLPKNETVLEGATATVFFAPVMKKEA